MKIPIPFTKGKIIDLSLKSQSTFYPLNQSTSELLGFDLGDLTSNQSEQKLIDKGYGQNVTVYAIIKKIAQSGADIPKVLIDENNPDEIITDGEVFDMLQQPAMLQGEVISQFDYFEALITYLLSSGNTYQRGLQATGFGDIWQKMEILPSGLTVPVVGNSFLSPVAGYQFNDKKRDLKFSKDDIIHTKFVNPTKLGLNTLEGLSPLQAAIYALTGSTDIQKAIAIMVKNQGARGVLSNKSDRIMTPEQAKILADRANENLRGVNNFNKIQVSNTEMSYVQIGMSSTDLKIIESGVLTDRQLCNAFSAPSVLFNDPANSSYNNYSTALKTFYTDAVLPVCNKVLADTNNKWLSQWSKRDGKRYSWQLDTSSVEALQTDQKTEAEKDKIRMDGVNVILNMQTTSEAKKVLLIEEYDYSEDTAEALVSPVGTVNKTLETLKSLSPLLANKLVDGLNEQDKQNLLK